MLGSLVAVLSVLTAVAGYQGSMTDGDQAKYTILGQQMLTDANAEYLSANQMIVYDYSLYDGYYVAEEAEKEEYYQASFSEELRNSIAANAEDPFSDAYYEAMYAGPAQHLRQRAQVIQVAAQVGIQVNFGHWLLLTLLTPRMCI